MITIDHYLQNGSAPLYLRLHDFLVLFCHFWSFYGIII